MHFARKVKDETKIERNSFEHVIREKPSCATQEKVKYESKHKRNSRGQVIRGESSCSTQER